MFLSLNSALEPTCGHANSSVNLLFVFNTSVTAVQYSSLLCEVQTTFL